MISTQPLQPEQQPTVTPEVPQVAPQQQLVTDPNVPLQQFQPIHYQAPEVEKNGVPKWIIVLIVLGVVGMLWGFLQYQYVSSQISIKTVQLNNTERQELQTAIDRAENMKIYVPAGYKAENAISQRDGDALIVSRVLFSNKGKAISIIVSKRLLECEGGELTTISNQEICTRNKNTFQYAQWSENNLMIQVSTLDENLSEEEFNKVVASIIQSK